ncbi:MAG: cupin domain-containing protein [Alphaproteobacteria bacterium]
MDGSVQNLEHLRSIASLDVLQNEVGNIGLTPGWIPRKQPILWHEPKSKFLPMHWRYAEAKAAMEAAGRLIGTDLAERRNLVMRNPIEGNNFATTNTLVCAYQTILPREEARSHRHAPHALRVILEAEGAFSIVDGEKTPMNSGDVVLTPGGCWHGHGHDGSEQAYWFDGLDVPLNHLLEPMFVEDHPAGFEPVRTVADRSPMRFKRDDILAALDKAPLDPEGFYGNRLPLDAPSIPTMGLHVRKYKSGYKSRPYRSTANTIFLVMQGNGTSTIDGVKMDWAFGDTFVAPLWTRIEHTAKDDAILFSMTDEPLMRWAKYFRFEALS